MLKPPPDVTVGDPVVDAAVNVVLRITTPDPPVAPILSRPAPSPPFPVLAPPGAGVYGLLSLDPPPPAEYVTEEPEIEFAVPLPPAT
jgi:hypothetical protein